ncbi:MAG TPA: tetraacyldisaccharide 4'-kinase [Rhizomicrobium sp.]|jgi:tetraacyldisaccharide 4'-kinase|nr:tetraacyldisaccharide 4'-kinase [Rhizomicrobium sp.]
MRPPDFWNAKTAQARLALAALSPLSWAYGASVRWKRDHAHPYRPDAKVVCVGNLTTGGTGKTPIAIAVARALADRNMRPFILSRGYGGRARGPVLVDVARDTAQDVGDEPLLLARAAPVIVARQRAAGAEFADSYDAGAIVMDDGFQNFEIAKDLSFVVADAATGFGNERVLPAGPLREPVAQGLARANAVILVGDGEPDLKGFAGPVLRARLVPVDVVGLNGTDVVAFAGIGRPDKFFDTLRSLGARLAETREYADHHAYSASEIARLKAKARGALLVTTEKDYVRLTPQQREGVKFLPVRAAFDDPAALSLLLDRIAPAQ